MTTVRLSASESLQPKPSSTKSIVAFTRTLLCRCRVTDTWRHCSTSQQLLQSLRGAHARLGLRRSGPGSTRISGDEELDFPEQLGLDVVRDRR